MTVEDLTLRILALLEGVEGTYTCQGCRRGLRVGLSTELWRTAVALRLALGQGPAVTPEEASRFALLEVDE